MLQVEQTKELIPSDNVYFRQRGGFPYEIFFPWNSSKKISGQYLSRGTLLSILIQTSQSEHILDVQIIYTGDYVIARVDGEVPPECRTTTLN